MTFWDHLEELRGVIIRSVLLLLACFTALFFFKDFLFDGIILRPTQGDFWLYRLLGVGMNLDLINIDISAQFFTHIKVSFICALVVSFPFLFFFLWQFIAPGLYDNEKRTIRGAFALGAVLFYLGLAVGYFIVMPILLTFFNGYQVSANVTNTFSLNSYISIFTSMVFLMGILFEFPSVLAILSQFGIVTRSFLRQYRRHAVLVLLVLAAVLTPTGDPFTMLVVAAPLYLLYEFSILLCREGAKEVITDDESTA